MPGPASNPVSDRESYAAYIASNTGLDPRVVLTWMMGEGDPGDLPGYYNYMNIKSSTAAYNHDPYIGTGPAGTAIFGSLSRGEKAALDEIRALHLGNEKGKSIAQQISDIAASPWASSHYGGPGGPNLVRDFQSAYPGVSIGQPAQNSPYAAPGGQGVNILNPGQVLSAAGDAAGDVFGAVTNPIEKGLLRVGLVLGGFLLAMIGLWLITSGMGLAPGLGTVGGAIVTKGRSLVGSGGSEPRRKGDAAAERGEEVTRTDKPRPLDNVDRRQMRTNQRRRDRAAKAESDRFGEVPF